MQYLKKIFLDEPGRKTTIIQHAFERLASKEDIPVEASRTVRDHLLSSKQDFNLLFQADQQGLSALFEKILRAAGLNADLAEPIAQHFLVELVSHSGNPAQNLTGALVAETHNNTQEIKQQLHAQQTLLQQVLGELAQQQSTKNTLESQREELKSLGFKSVHMDVGSGTLQYEPPDDTSFVFTGNTQRIQDALEAASAGQDVVIDLQAEGVAFKPSDARLEKYLPEKKAGFIHITAAKLTQNYLFDVDGTREHVACWVRRLKNPDRIEVTPKNNTECTGVVISTGGKTSKIDFYIKNPDKFQPKDLFNLNLIFMLTTPHGDFSIFDAETREQLAFTVLPAGEEQEGNHIGALIYLKYLRLYFHLEKHGLFLQPIPASEARFVLTEPEVDRVVQAADMLDHNGRFTAHLRFDVLKTDDLKSINIDIVDGHTRGQVTVDQPITVGGQLLTVMRVQFSDPAVQLIDLATGVALTHDTLMEAVDASNQGIAVLLDARGVVSFLREGFTEGMMHDTDLDSSIVIPLQDGHNT